VKGSQDGRSNGMEGTVVQAGAGPTLFVRGTGRRDTHPELRWVRLDGHDPLAASCQNINLQATIGICKHPLGCRNEFK
jgi:hypothetical protein